MHQPTKRTFTLHYKQTTKAITIKPHLDSLKTLEQLKSRFGIGADQVVIGLVERTEKREFWRFDNFLNEYSTIVSDRFTIVTKEITGICQIRFIEYSEEAKDQQGDDTPIVILIVDSLDKLRKLRLYCNPFAVYFYQLGDRAQFDYQYKSEERTNVSHLVLNDLLYKNQPLDFSFGEFEKMYSVLDIFVDLVSHRFTPQTIEVMIGSLFFKKTFLVFMVQILRSFHKGLYSHQEMLDKTEVFIKRQFGVSVGCIYKKMDTHKKELKGGVPLYAEPKARLMSRTAQDAIDGTALEQINSITTRHYGRGQSELRSDKNRDEGGSIEIYNRLNVVRDELGGMVAEDFRSPPTSPDIPAMKMDAPAVGLSGYQQVLNPNVFSQVKARPGETTSVIREESESESVDVYNIYDEASISDSQSGDPEQFEKKRTNTADFENRELKEGAQQNREGRKRGEDPKQRRDSENHLSSLQIPKLVSDQNMLGLDNNSPSASLEQQSRHRDSNRFGKNVGKHISPTETPLLIQSDRGYQERAKSQSLHARQLTGVPDYTRKRAATDKRFSFKKPDGDEITGSQDLLSTQILANDDFKSYETLLIEVVLHLQPNEMQKKLIWQLFHNKNDNLRYALDYYKRYRSMQLLINVLNHYIELVDVEQQERLQVLYPQKSLSLESCRNLLNVFVSQKHISIRTQNLILTYLVQGSLTVLSTFELYLKTNDLEDFIENLKLVEDITMRNFSGKYVNLKSALVFKPKDINYLAEQQQAILNVFRENFTVGEVESLTAVFSFNRLTLYEQYNKYLKDLDADRFIANIKLIAATRKAQDTQATAENAYSRSAAELYTDRKCKIDLVDKYVVKSKQRLNREFLLSKALENDLVLSGIAELGGIGHREDDILENIELYFKLTFFERKYKKVNEVIEKADLTQSQIKFLQDTIKIENEPFLMAAIKLFEQNLKEDQFIEQVKIILNNKSVV